MVSTGVRDASTLPLTRLVEGLIAEFPGFDEYDLAELVEERTRRRVLSDDWQEIVRVFERRRWESWVGDE